MSENKAVPQYFNFRFRRIHSNTSLEKINIYNLHEELLKKEIHQDAFSENTGKSQSG